MKKSVLILLLVSTVILSHAQQGPSCSLIGVKYETDNSVFQNVTGKCYFFELSGYDYKNPEHYEAIRQFILKNIQSFVSKEDNPFAGGYGANLYFFDRSVNLNNFSCGKSPDLEYLLIDARIPTKTPDHDYKRLIHITPNPMYGYNGNNMPKEVKSNHSVPDMFWY